MMFAVFILFTISIFVDSLHRKRYILSTDYLDYLFKNNKEYIHFSKYIIAGVIFLINMNISFLIALVAYWWGLVTDIKDLQKLRSYSNFNKRTIHYGDEKKYFHSGLIIDILYLCYFVFLYKQYYLYIYI